MVGILCGFLFCVWSMQNLYIIRYTYISERIALDIRFVSNLIALLFFQRFPCMSLIMTFCDIRVV